MNQSNLFRSKTIYKLVDSMKRIRNIEESLKMLSAFISLTTFKCSCYQIEILVSFTNMDGHWLNNFQTKKMYICLDYFSFLTIITNMKLVTLFIPISIWKQVTKCSRSSPTMHTYFQFYYFSAFIG